MIEALKMFEYTQAQRREAGDQWYDINRMRRESACPSYEETRQRIAGQPLVLLRSPAEFPCASRQNRGKNLARCSQEVDKAAPLRYN